MFFWLWWLSSYAVVAAASLLIPTTRKALRNGKEVDWTMMIAWLITCGILATIIAAVTNLVMLEGEMRG